MINSSKSGKRICSQICDIKVNWEICQVIAFAPKDLKTKQFALLNKINWISNLKVHTNGFKINLVNKITLPIPVVTNTQCCENESFIRTGHCTALQFTALNLSSLYYHPTLTLRRTVKIYIKPSNFLPKKDSVWILIHQIEVFYFFLYFYKTIYWQ